MRLMEMLDRKRGALIGLAIGDALGAPIDLELPGDFPAITGFRGGGRNDLKPGEWANHTSMALALADSIATAGWDLNDQARRYVAWWREGKYTVRGRSFHVSAIMQQSLKRFLDTGYALASGDRAEESSSSGPLTRLAPVVIRYAEFFPRRPENMIWLAIDSSLPTHASPQCLSACAYLSLVLCGLVHGIDRETVLSPHWEPLRKLNEVHALHSEVAEVAAGSFRCERCPSIVGSAYVVKSLEASAVGVPRCRRIPPGRAPRGEPRGRRRCSGRDLRPACRRLVGRVRHSGRLAAVAGPLRHARPGLAAAPEGSHFMIGE